MRTIIVSVGTSVLLLVGIVSWAQSRVPIPGPTGPIETPRPALRQEPETPQQFFTRYMAAMQSAKKIEDLYPFWGANLINQSKLMPPEAFSGLKDGYTAMTGLKVTQATVADTGATLTLEGVFNGLTKTGTMYLTKENGAWKVFTPENWRTPSP